MSCPIPCRTGSTCSMAVPSPPPPWGDIPRAMLGQRQGLPDLSVSGCQLVDLKNVPVVVTAWLPCETDDKARCLARAFLRSPVRRAEISRGFLKASRRKGTSSARRGVLPGDKKDDPSSGTLVRGSI